MQTTSISMTAGLPVINRAQFGMSTRDHGVTDTDRHDH